MAEDPPTPWPPPDPGRPFDWKRDAPEWGDDGMPEDQVGCLMVVFATIALAAGMVILYVTLLR
ncbi:MAG TPA: hypothetical protein VH482_17400 [Thermomicrobiales bacterium]|jgi:hypothetical protein